MADAAGPPDRHALALEAAMRVARQVDAVLARPRARVVRAVAAREVVGRADDAVGDVHRQLHLADELRVERVAHLVRLDLARGLDVVVDLVEHGDARGLQLADQVQPEHAAGLLDHDDLVVEEVLELRRLRAEAGHEVEAGHLHVRHPGGVVDAERDRRQEAPVVRDHVGSVPDEDGLRQLSRLHQMISGTQGLKSVLACLNRRMPALVVPCSRARRRPPRARRPGRPDRGCTRRRPR